MTGGDRAFVRHSTVERATTHENLAGPNDQAARLVVNIVLSSIRREQSKVSGKGTCIVTRGLIEDARCLLRYGSRGNGQCDILHKQLSITGEQDPGLEQINKTHPGLTTAGRRN
jgi:hypothetical protein